MRVPHDAAPVKFPFHKRRGDERGPRNDRHLPELDSQIERQERREEFCARQPQLAEHAGESQPVQQPEHEHERDAPRFSSRVNRFSIATYAIDSAISGSTTRGGSETMP